jgi:hypothetical protein
MGEETGMKAACPLLLEVLPPFSLLLVHPPLTPSLQVLIGIIFIPNKAPTAGLLTSGAVFLYCRWAVERKPKIETRDGALDGIGDPGCTGFLDS